MQGHFRRHAGKYIVGAAIAASAVISPHYYHPSSKIPTPLPITNPGSSMLPADFPAHCTLQGNGITKDALPDPNCTPGEANAEVTQATIQDNICNSSFRTGTIRPPTSYTNPLKRELMARYGLTDSPANYELDHLISLTDGGDPRSPYNLFPQPYNPAPGAKDKDKVELYVHKQICSGALTVDEGRTELAKDWTQFLSKVEGGFGSTQPAVGEDGENNGQ